MSPTDFREAIEIFDIAHVGLGFSESISTRPATSGESANSVAIHLINNDYLPRLRTHIAASASASQVSTSAWPVKARTPNDPPRAAA
ncbi:hypothetical protein MMB232_01333 [Brevundimonas subvibrioides]